MSFRDVFRHAGLLACFSLIVVGIRGEGRELPGPALKVQLAYAAYSLDPRSYDDWSSVFLANHIYPRLLPVPGKPWLASVARNLRIDCMQTSGKSGCERNRIRFEIEPFTDCSGKVVGAVQIKSEFLSILKAKTWMLPGWSECTGPSNGVCVELPGHADLERRLEAIYFRFGWSGGAINRPVVGAGPYCLADFTRKGDMVSAGHLVPRDRTGLSPITFDVSQDSGTDFSLALQGTKELLRGSRKNVQPHTPLPYYVVTNPALAGRRLPWNDRSTAEVIRAHLQNTGMAYDAPPALLDVAPAGNAIDLTKRRSSTKGDGVTFLIPDYIPECGRLAHELNRLWKAGSFRTSVAVCGNLVDFMEKQVHAKHGTAGAHWDGFLISLSPGAPERGAIYDQYFSPKSAESLTGQFPEAGQSFYRVGMGQSLVTVDGRVLCDVAPTSLGLGDLTVADFIPCKSGTR